MGMYMNTSPALATAGQRQDKGREGTSHDMKLSGQTEQHPLHGTASWVSICIAQTSYLHSSVFVSAEP